MPFKWNRRIWYIKRKQNYGSNNKKFLMKLSLFPNENVWSDQSVEVDYSYCDSQILEMSNKKLRLELVVTSPTGRK